MVIPRSLSSGALSMLSKATASPVPKRLFNTVVIAAVNVGFTVVYVTDGTNVNMWFGSFKFFFSHFVISLKIIN